MNVGASLVLMAAGGTVGHVFPAEAMAAELMARGVRVALVTDRRVGELKGGLGTVEIHRIRAGGLAGKSLVQRLRNVPELAVGFFQARGLLARLRPAVVVGFGGYASVPTMMAATLGGYRTAIHEQNAILGRANRLLASRVGRIATSFEHCRGIPAEARRNVVHTGMPVRAAVAAVGERPFPSIESGQPISILVIGGSQGARVLSDVVPAAIGRLDAATRGRFAIQQQCRPEDLDRVRRAYADIGVAADLASFFADVPERLARTHLLICRAGASTVAEATAAGRPSILIPYPHAIDDHQSANAKATADAGAAWLMPEPAFTLDALAARLKSLADRPSTLDVAAACARAAGRPDAARRLADAVCAMIPNGNRDSGKAAA